LIQINAPHLEFETIKKTMGYPLNKFTQIVNNDPIIPLSTSGCALCAIGPLNISGSLEANKLCDLELVAEQVILPEHGLLLEQDAPANHICVLVEGVVRLSKFLPDGRRQILGFGLPGNVTGFQTHDRYSFSVEAVTSIKACRFSRASFFDLMNKRPYLARKFFDLLAQELSFAQDQIAILGYRSAEKRVASFLVNLRDRWARIVGSDKFIPMPMSRQDIADFLGLRVETVSRTISQMSREMLIETGSGHVRIINDGPIYDLLAV
jgi:CRP/FNR family transcriptional regulator, anaerobic regulatory protein